MKRIYTKKKSLNIPKIYIKFMHFYSFLVFLFATGQAGKLQKKNENEYIAEAELLRQISSLQNGRGWW